MIRRALSSVSADIVVLPELVTSGYVFSGFEEAESVAVEPSSLAWWGAFGALVVGGFCERGDDGRLYNSAAVVDGSGVVAVYRKTHLWDRERLIFTPGDAVPPVLDTAFGRLGVLVCYDLEFPEMPRSLALRGAELLCVPVNWPVVERPPAGEHPPEQLTAMSAARVNRVFIAVCDRVGAERGVEWVGGTAVIDENGWIVGGVGGGHRPRPSPATRSSRACGRLRRPSPGALRRGHGRGLGTNGSTGGALRRHRSCPRLWLSVPAAGTPTVTGEDQDPPSIRSP